MKNFKGLYLILATLAVTGCASQSSNTTEYACVEASNGTMVSTMRLIAHDSDPDKIYLMGYEATVELDRVVSASGEKYENELVSLWLKGEEAIVYAAGTPLYQCVINIQ